VRPPFAATVADLALEPGILAPDQILEGTPAVTECVLSTSPDGRIVTGVWQITPGVVTDVEADEVFVVVSGRATVEFEDGPPLELIPGVVGVLRAGDRTVWRVRETLRKVFTLTSAQAAWPDPGAADASPGEPPPPSRGRVSRSPG
jgi:uncharacterized cupin superfamily protein